MAIQLTRDILLKMAQSPKSYAEWARILRTSVAELDVALGMARQNARLAWYVTDAVEATNAAAGAGAGLGAGGGLGAGAALETEAGLSAGAMFGIGVSVFAFAVIFGILAYQVYQRNHRPKVDEESTETVAQEDPNQLTPGGYYTGHELHGKGNFTQLMPGGNKTGTQPAGQKKPIDLPSGGSGGKDFFSTQITAVAGGPVGSMDIKRIEEENRRRDEEEKRRVYTAFGGTFRNIMPGRDIEPVPQAKFEQSKDGWVTGWIWVTKNKTDKGYDVHKLKITHGLASGSELVLEADDGAVKGVLRLEENGRILKGYLNDSEVTLYRQVR